MSEEYKPEFKYFDWEDISATEEERKEAEKTNTRYPKYHYRVKTSEFTLHLLTFNGRWTRIIDHFYLGYLDNRNFVSNVEIPYDSVGTFENGEEMLYNFICNWMKLKKKHLDEFGSLIEEISRELDS